MDSETPRAQATAVVAGAAIFYPPPLSLTDFSRVNTRGDLADLINSGADPVLVKQEEAGGSWVQEDGNEGMEVDGEKEVKFIGEFDEDEHSFYYGEDGKEEEDESLLEEQEHKEQDEAGEEEQSEGEERAAGEMREKPAPAALQNDAADATDDPEPEGDQQVETGRACDGGNAGSGRETDEGEQQGEQEREVEQNASASEGGGG
jgi:hypothetical protein